MANIMSDSMAFIVNSPDQMDVLISILPEAEFTFLDTSFVDVHGAVSIIQNFVCTASGEVDFTPVLSDYCYYLR